MVFCVIHLRPILLAVFRISFHKMVLKKIFMKKFSHHPGANEWKVIIFLLQEPEMQTRLKKKDKKWQTAKFLISYFSKHYIRPRYDTFKKKKNGKLLNFSFPISASITCAPVMTRLKKKLKNGKLLNFSFLFQQALHTPPLSRWPANSMVMSSPTSCLTPTSSPQNANTNTPVRWRLDA